MRNLIDFIWKHQFTLIFMVLELIGFYLLSTNNNHHQTKMHTLGVVLSGTLFDMQDSYSQYIGLRQENELLRQENATLRQAQVNPENTTKRVMKQGFVCVPTIALNSSYNREKNAIIVNKGTAAGVSKESGVISPTGVAGIVHSVSENYASVLPLIHTDSRISGRIKRTQHFGQCRWDGDDDQYMILENIPNHVTFNRGDTIVTRGAGGVFPAGLVIGFAETAERDESSGFQEIKVRLATNFRSVSSLYIIVNEHKTELDSLERETTTWTD